MKNNDAIFGYLFAVPSIMFLGIFIIYPMFSSLFLSFIKWDLLSPNLSFVGVKNYINLFKSPLFYKVLKNTFFFTIGSMTLVMSLAVLLAVILNQKLKAKNFYRSLIFSPYITPMVVIAIIWMWIYNPEFGLANYFLQLIGLPLSNWLRSFKMALPSIIFLTVWKDMGYYMILYLAGLQGISASLYESAEMDGASAFRKFRSITLPLLTPTTFFVLITSFLSSFKVFDQISIMTAGGPADETNVMVYYLYQNAFMYFKVGYASAIAVIIFIILLIVTVFQFKGSNKWVYYG